MNEYRPELPAPQALSQLLLTLRPLNRPARTLAENSDSSIPGTQPQNFGRPEIFDPSVAQDVSQATVLVTGPYTLSDLQTLVKASDLPPRSLVLPTQSAGTKPELAGFDFLPVFEKVATASWSELNWLLTCIAQLQAVSAPDTEPLLTQKLMDIADSLATRTGCAITIEDPQSNVLAYSSRQVRSDEIRLRTILERRVPDERREELEDQGFFDRVWASSEPVDRPHVDGRPERLVMRVVHKELRLGMIWAAHSADRFDDTARQQLCAASEELAPLLLLWQKQAQILTRIQDRAAAAVFAAGSDNSRAEEILGIDRNSEQTVLKIVLSPHSEPSQREAVNFYVQKMFPGALIDPTHHGESITLTIDTTEMEPGELLSAADSLAAAAKASAGGLRIIIGEPRRGDGKVAASAQTTNDIEDLLYHSPKQLADLRVIDRSAVWESVAVLQTMRLLADTGSDLLRLVEPIVDYDREHQTQLLTTLTAFLSSFGDYAKAAQKLTVHPNTVRYRVKRIEELVTFDLDDPDQVLAWLLAARAAEYSLTDL